jgi:hypothetical protein
VGKYAAYFLEMFVASFAANKAGDNELTPLGDSAVSVDRNNVRQLLREKETHAESAGLGRICRPFIRQGI